MNNAKKELKKEGNLLKYSRGLLLAAIVSNSAALFLNLYVGDLDDSLGDAREKERYFMTNQQAISAETAKRTSMHVSLNQLKMLRRISKERLAPAEYKSLLHDEEVFQRLIDSSLVKIVGALYLQANDPEPGFNPDKYFSSLSQDELSNKWDEYEEKAFLYAKTIKKEMVTLSDRASFFKKIYTSLIIASTLLLLIANYQYFRAGKLNCDIN